VIASSALETLEGILGVCADKVMVSGLIMNIQECLVHAMKFCCEDAIKTVEVIGKHLAFIEDGTTGQTIKYEPINFNR
jgi:hypothetical protein